MIMGGSFDPIHLGHLVVAERAAEELGAGRVLFVPCCVPPHKEADGLTPARHRLRMIELAIRGNPRFRASDIEIRRGGVSYTVETIAELRRRYGAGARIFFLIGADSLAEIHTWREHRALLRACTVATVGRPGFDPGGWTGAGSGLSRREVSELKKRIVCAPLVGISSTEIRRRRREGRSIRYLVPEAVERYIAAHGLYRTAARGRRVRCRGAREQASPQRTRRQR